MKIPKFFREHIDKDTDAKDEYKGELKKAGAEYKKRKSTLEEREMSEGKVLEKKNEEIQQAEREKTKTEVGLGELTKKLDTLKRGFFSGVLNFFQIRSVEKKITEGESKIKELTEAHETALLTREEMIQALEDISKELSQAKGEVKEEVKKLMADFFSERKQEWKESDYEAQEAKDLFSEKHLSSLSVEDYALLMGRFPSHIVTHVTRQGVRDHTGHMWHSAGMGELQQGFVGMTESGRLKNALSIAVEQKGSRAAVAEQIGLDIATTREEALTKLDSMINPGTQGGQGTYADRMAIHFASEEVADTYYGAEHKNEIFVVYPSIMIDSQYVYNGNLTESGGGYWNDQWVWVNEEDGISLDAGITFIPADAQVDPETGSQYKVDEEGGAEVRSDRVELLDEIANSDWIADFASKVKEKYSEAGWRGVYSQQFTELKAYLVQKGIDDTDVQNMLCEYDAVTTLERLSKEDPDNEFDKKQRPSRLREVLTKHHLLYRRSESTISSREYWQEYFKKNPGQEPNKIVFYVGGDPTKALRQFKQQHGLEKRAQKDELRSVGSREDRMDSMTQGLSRFEEIAMRLIDEKFPEQDTAQVEVA